MGDAAQSRPATFKYNFQTHIALHSHNGHYAVVSVAISGDLNWHRLAACLIDLTRPSIGQALAGDALLTLSLYALAQASARQRLRANSTKTIRLKTLIMP
jgi:hypothetical protein